MSSQDAPRGQRRSDERGYALAGILVLMLLGLVLGSAGLTAASLNTKSAAHYDTGNQALYSAESGALHAIGTINTTRVINFEQDIANRWTELFGDPTKDFPSDANIGYQVALAADPANPKNAGTLTITGSAQLAARRVLQIGLAKDDFAGSPGAIYLANDVAEMTFNGNAFGVNGNDHDRFGNPSGSGITKPGISTRQDSVAEGVANSLSAGQKDNVLGEGFSTAPLSPSVLNTGGPSVGDLDQFVTDLLQTLIPAAGSSNLTQSDLLAAPSCPVDVDDCSVYSPTLTTYSLDGGTTYTKTTTDDGNLLSLSDGTTYLESTKTSWNGNDTLGTLDNPQITHIDASDVHMLGNASGAGVLIVDGSLTIRGSFDYVGWIIVRGKTTVDSESTLSGDATVTGSLWTSQLELGLGGSMLVDYCHECLQMIDSISPTNDNALPRPMRIVSWQEVY